MLMLLSFPAFRSSLGTTVVLFVLLAFGMSET